MKHADFVLGRFGWKASQPNVEQQTASALRNDMGITNPVFPEQLCSPDKDRCRRIPNGNGHSGTEVEPKLLDAITLFSASIALPERPDWNDETVLKGREHFYQLGCADCHQPNFRTSSQTENPAFAAQQIWPYSDFLLHDMGEGLADELRHFQAEGNEWRTAPLWGLSVIKRINPQTGYLHDGRASTLSEAILWHGGEAADAQQKYNNLSRGSQAELIRFLESL